MLRGRQVVCNAPAAGPKDSQAVMATIDFKFHASRCELQQQKQDCNFALPSRETVNLSRRPLKAHSLKQKCCKRALLAMAELSEPSSLAEAQAFVGRSVTKYCPPAPEVRQQNGASLKSALLDRAA